MFRPALVLLAALCAACGTADVELVRDGGQAISFVDADPTAPDSGPNVGCDPAGAECNNCIDDDGDMKVDGFDPHCTGPLDDDESSFDTNIPGDNNNATRQDCAFDGNSGPGNDGCDLHTCCLLVGECPAELDQGYDPDDCEVTDECRDNCGPITPPGCDCFGCCTICNDDGCWDVFTNPTVAPECDIGVLDDDAKCPKCNLDETCGTTCDPDNCILCPGQTIDDLPPQCMDAQCPDNLTPCASNTDCLSDEFCATGCCIGAIS